MSEITPRTANKNQWSIDDVAVYLMFKDIKRSLL